LSLLVLGAFALWLEPTRVVWGWLRGEAFYQGRPTSWWASELERWDCQVAFASFLGPEGEKGCRRIERFYRKNTEFEQRWKRWFNIEETNAPAPGVLTGDPAAEAVLLALAEHPSEHVQDLASRGLLRLRQRAAWEREQEAEHAQLPP
jgi:hypothetical protein